MATSNNRNEPRQHPGIPDCVDRENATQQKINTLKKIYCQKLSDSDSEIHKLTIGYESNEKIYKSKERRFLSTRDNCQRYINTEISMGSQLVQANEKIKASVSNFKTWDESLSKNLKEIFAAVKDVKTKMSDLRDAAIKLENSKQDSCNATQWALITGKSPDCKDDTTPVPPVESKACRDAEDAIELLLCIPRALLLDVDSVFKSSSDVIGVQKFCNTGSLVALHQNLYTSAQEFDNLLLETIKVRKTDLDNSQQELKEALKTRTGSLMDLYSQRSDYDGIRVTLEKMCCPKCGCVNEEIGNCEPRLENCEKDICEICGEVRNAFISQEAAPPPPAPES